MLKDSKVKILQRNLDTEHKIVRLISREMPSWFKHTRSSRKQVVTILRKFLSIKVGLRILKGMKLLLLN